MAQGGIHKGIEFDVREVEPGRWLWVIHAPDRATIGESRFPSREATVDACIEAINNHLHSEPHIRVIDTARYSPHSHS